MDELDSDIPLMNYWLLYTPLYLIYKVFSTGRTLHCEPYGLWVSEANCKQILNRSVPELFYEQVPPSTPFGFVGFPKASAIDS
jgi:hypothetical protein